MDILEILTELEKFNSPDFKSFNGVASKEIEELEEKINLKFPNDFIFFLKNTNGVLINCQNIYGINPEKPNEDLFENYKFETKEAGNPMPKYLLPIYPDGMGNHNCLDLKSISEDGNFCNVVFWQHDRFYTHSEKPDIDAKSFTDFFENLLKNLKEQF